LQTLLVKQWEELNHTQITTLDISANLNSIEELSVNISTPADAPTLQEIGMLMCIHFKGVLLLHFCFAYVHST